MYTGRKNNRSTSKRYVLCRPAIHFALSSALFPSVNDVWPSPWAYFRFDCRMQPIVQYVFQSNKEENTSTVGSNAAGGPNELWLVTKNTLEKQSI